MGGSQGVKIEGLRETIRSLEKFGTQATDLKAAFQRIGQNVANEAKSEAPKLSGALAASIKPSNTKNKSVIRAGSARVPYAGVINYGGYHNIVGQHFMEGAVAAKRFETISALRKELDVLISKLDLK